MITGVLEHCDDKGMEPFDEKAMDILVTCVMQLCDDKGMEHCDEKGKEHSDDMRQGAL